ncbi:HAD family hydrolase [Microcoleus sp. FACHB-1515]|uniref:HAD family hydrolase n=1 Tax=Cyanophyceae TaxID=3028117 RepID=UPI001685EAB0|nr:HAD family hydrolase [Microcoleus sp. FACHB-1515]MBD2090545.1 HAD family hydrolase [Microcoleus sp. FACHB-1515]
MDNPTILALDFDGVLCDGLIEYFQTAWRVYVQLWHPIEQTPPAGLAEQFYRLRPVVETGWEMPVVIRSLLQGVPEAEILLHWSEIAVAQIAADSLSAADLGAAVDRVRDEWIQADLAGWLSEHRFYPGVIDRLRELCDSPVRSLIITTKEGRFVQQLLQQQGISLSADRILGKEVKQPKTQSLRQIRQPNDVIWFVEDRLKTLQTITTQADLADVRLFLADWGYNTPDDRQTAAEDDRIELLSIQQFCRDFSQW